MDYLWSDRKRTFLGLPWSFTKYNLTEERLFIETGFFNKKEDEVRLYRITDVSLTRSFGQRIVGVGTIHCCSGDKTLGDFDITSVKNPKDVKEQLSELVEKQRDSKRVTSREFIGSHDHGEHDDYDDHDHDDYDEHM